MPKRVWAKTFYAPCMPYLKGNFVGLTFLFLIKQLSFMSIPLINSKDLT